MNDPTHTSRLVEPIMFIIDTLLEEDHWPPGDGDWSETLIDIRDRVESALYELYASRDERLFVNFEDGYVIGKILPGSPLLK